MDTMKRLASEKPVVIFSKTIKTLICNFGANPAVHKLDEMSNGQQLERALVAASVLRSSFPAVFIGRELVGGADEIMSLHVKGELVPLLKKAKAIWLLKDLVTEKAH